MIRLLIFCLLVFFVYKIFRALLRSLPHGQGNSLPPEKTQRGEDMVQDPQCGTYVPRGDALTASVRGQRHHFCSAKCRDDFLRSS
ncbi:MAG: YHS domain-containing protein [Desulfuromonadales bacterium]|nr:YHS domain-containing protein [Desulfuromonadales bacterium]